MPESEMETGHFFFTQPNLIHQLTDPTQPILPTHEPTQPTHFLASKLSIGI